MASAHEHSRQRYSSQTVLASRQAAQMLLLKPFLHRILKVRVHGVENLENLGRPFVVFGNHSSHFDGPLILSALPANVRKHVAVGAAADYFYDKWWKSLPMTLFMNGYPVDRGKGGKAERGLSSALLADDIPVLLFPEGSRSRTGAMGPFKPGAAALCISNGCPALPVALVGAFEAWPSTQRELPRGRPEVHIVIGRPMVPRPGEIAHSFSERMRRQLWELHDTAALAYGRKTLAAYARDAAIEQAKQHVAEDSSDDAQPKKEDS